MNGNTVQQHATMLPAEEICQWVEHLRCRSGVDIVRTRKGWFSAHPSIQGIWTPFTNRDTKLSVTQFPNKEFSKCSPVEQSATDRLLLKAKQLRAKTDFSELTGNDENLQKVTKETS